MRIPTDYTIPCPWCDEPIASELMSATALRCDACATVVDVAADVPTATTASRRVELAAA
jgi:hypothetical protein